VASSGHGFSSHRHPLETLSEMAPALPEKRFISRLETYADGLITMLDDAHRHAAVNNEVFAGDEVIFNQSHNQLRDVLGLALSM
jgi:hypothetical protein